MKRILPPNYLQHLLRTFFRFLVRVTSGHAQTPGLAQQASYWRRFLATLLDYAAASALAFVTVALGFIPIMSSIETSSSPLLVALVTGFAFTLFFLAPLLLLNPYKMSRPGLRNGQTFGKRWVGVVAKRDDGRPWTFKTAVFRETIYKVLLPNFVLGIVELFSILLTSGSAAWMQGLGIAIAILVFIGMATFILWPLFDPERRGIHDRLARSHVFVAANLKKN